MNTSLSQVYCLRSIQPKLNRVDYQTMCMNKTSRVALVPITRRTFIAMGASAALAPLPVAADDWIVLGEKRVSLLSDRDIIMIGPRKGLFTGLKLRVTGSAVHFDQVTVVLSNGERKDLTIRSLIRAGGETREMLLPGLVRAIIALDMRYRRVLGGGSASVVAYGRRFRG